MFYLVLQMAGFNSSGSHEREVGDYSTEVRGDNVNGYLVRELKNGNDLILAAVKMAGS